MKKIALLLIALLTLGTAQESMAQRKTAVKKTAAKKATTAKATAAKKTTASKSSAANTASFFTEQPQKQLFASKQSVRPSAEDKTVASSETAYKTAYEPGSFTFAGGTAAAPEKKLNTKLIIGIACGALFLLLLLIFFF